MHMVKTLAGAMWPNNTTKPSAGYSDQINETSQIISTKGDQTQNTTQQQLGLDSHMGGSKEMEKRDIRERTRKTAQRGSVLSEDGISAQPETKPAGKTYASTAATPASTNQGRGASVGVTSENINKRHHSQQAAVGEQPVSPSGGPSETVRGHSRAGTRYSPHNDRGRSELIELRKKLVSSQQERDTVIQAKDSIQRQLDDAEKRNRNLEEHNTRQSEQLQMMTSHLRQAEDLHRQTLELLEVKTSELKGAQAFLSKEDSLAGADLIGMVGTLNAEILQVAAFMVDSLEDLERDHMDEGDGPPLKPSVNLGEHIIQALKAGLGQSDFDPLPAQVALQVCLVSVSSWIIQSWIPGLWRYDSMLSGIYNDIRATEGQSISGRWRALTCGHLRKYWQNYDKEVMALVSNEIANVLILTGYRRRVIGGEFLIKFRDRLGIIANLALRINEAIRVNVTSGDVRVMVVLPGVNFDSRAMADAFSEDEGSKKKRYADGHGIVAGTTDIGVESVVGNASMPDILKKPKVVLVSTLREGYPAI